MASMDPARATDLQRGIRIEIISIAWMVVEMAVSTGAGIAAHSILLTAFGIDSLIELVSGGILLWRLRIEGAGGDLDRVEQAEQRATWIVALTLGLLCAYVLISSVYGLLIRSVPASSWIGIGVSAAAVLVMPYLAVAKRRISRRINSDVLAGDATNSITCAYMAGTVLVGLLLNALFGWWWAENVAALLFLIWLVRETLEAFAEARESHKAT
jgi:divalent metal cation (Fe/Co/Zn/Cd) transporter